VTIAEDATLRLSPGVKHPRCRDYGHLVIAGQDEVLVEKIDCDFSGYRTGAGRIDAVRSTWAEIEVELI
jgi:hypothetical protein